MILIFINNYLTNSIILHNNDIFENSNKINENKSIIVNFKNMKNKVINRT